jgi:hypothetical protein
MRRFARLMLAALLLGWAHGVAPAADPGGPDPRSQVLVFLRIAPEHFHPGADYHAGYGGGMAAGARRHVAERLAREHGLILAGDWPLPLIGEDCFVMTAPPGGSPAALADALAKDPAVAWAEPMNLYRGEGAPEARGDPLLPVQPAAQEWKLAALHRLATGRNVSVAVIDSRIEESHPDLAGQVRISENFVGDRSKAAEQHGTGVAGVIAAREGNGVGIAGIAPHARLLALRACWQAGDATLCDSLSLAKALHFAIQHDAQVINLSLAGPPDRLLGDLLDVAIGRGATVVGAYDRSLPGGGFPASHAGVVAVAEEEDEDALPPGVFAAPGRDIPTTQPGGRWYLVSGSSYAAAHVSGLFALLRERKPASRGAAALATWRPRGGPIDSCASLEQATGPCDCACAHGPDLSPAAGR